jgi:hypothetical protein
MRFHLVFRFHHKAQAQAVAHLARNQPEPEGTGIPQRVQQRRPVAQLVQTLFGPCQMIGFSSAGA